MTKASFKALYDRIVLRPVEQEEKTSGGIIIPDTAKEKPIEGVVVAAGHGYRGDDGKISPLEVKVGDHVLYNKWSGTEVKVNGEALIVVKESDILLVLSK